MKFSLITVCFNSEKTIARTLKSVRQQSYKNIEHIIVDGASTDQTLSIINSEGEHISKVLSEKDDGIYDAMNKGINLATGDVIGFINSDDFYASENSIQEVARAFLANNIDSCYGDLVYVNKSNPNYVARYWETGNFKLGSFGEGWCPPHPTFFVKRSIYQRLGGFDLNFKIAADYELMIRFLEVEKISTFYIQKVIVEMQLGGATNRNISNIINQNFEIYRALIKNKIKFSILNFFFMKLLNRSKQFIKRPL